MLDVDLCVLCADTPPDRIQTWANLAALRTGTPWLVAMHGGPMVVTGIYLPGVTPCHQCSMHGLIGRSIATWSAPPLPQQTTVTATIAPTARPFAGVTRVAHRAGPSAHCCRSERTPKHKRVQGMRGRGTWWPRSRARGPDRRFTCFELRVFSSASGTFIGGHGRSARD
jgi:hypothetical protein